MKDMTMKAVEEVFEGDYVQGIIKEQIEKAIKESIGNMFGYGGEAKKLIESKIKSQMMPQLEQYNFDEHIIKLDTVLREVIKETTVDNKKILENFKDFFTTETPKEIKLSELHALYAKHCSEHVDTSDLEICYDDEPSYQYISCTSYANIDERWSGESKISFSCEEDEKLEKTIPLYISSDKKIKTLKSDELDIASLRQMDSFDVTLFKILNGYVTIIIDEEDGITTEEEVEAKPEYYCE